MIDLKKCQDCFRIYDGSEYRCPSCSSSNVITESLTQSLNWILSEINFLHLNKAEKGHTHD